MTDIDILLQPSQRSLHHPSPRNQRDCRILRLRGPLTKRSRHRRPRPSHIPRPRTPWRGACGLGAAGDLGKRGAIFPRSWRRNDVADVDDGIVGDSDGGEEQCDVFRVAFCCCGGGGGWAGWVWEFEGLRGEEMVMI